MEVFIAMNKKTHKVKIIATDKENFDYLFNFVNNLSDNVYLGIEEIGMDKGGYIYCVIKQQHIEYPIIYLPKKIHSIKHIDNTIIINCDKFYMKIYQPMSDNKISYNFNRTNNKNEDVDYLKYSP